MVIRYQRGDLLACDAQVVVIPVNCQGVAGCGLALACKRRYPHWFESYRLLCQQHWLTPGHPMLHDVERLIVSFPTKDDWRHPSQLDVIERGLVGLSTLLRDAQLASIAFPKLGCGAGGLSWSQVKPLMERSLSSWLCEVVIYVS